MTDGTQEFTAPEWLPGVDNDTAKFIVDATVKDLPTLAKTFVEQKRTLSAPRGYEVPKEGDAEGWKKFNAAIGVPETPDKYDFGEFGKTMKPEALKHWSGELHKLGIPNKQAAALVSTVTAQAAAQQKAEDEAFAKASGEGMEKLKLEWGNDFDRNYDLASRGMKALAKELGDLKPEHLTAMEKVLGTRAVHMLGLLVGRHTVEAGFVGADGQHKGMTVEAAKQRRAEMIADAETNKALYNQGHPKHALVAKEWADLLKVEFGAAAA